MVNSLIQQAKHGDQQAFVRLMEQHKQPLYRAARAILHNDEDIADAMQETVLRAWQALPSLRFDAYFKTWITRILIRECCRIIRAQNRTALLDELPAVPESTSPFQLRLEVEDVLRTLGENDRLLLMLFYANDLSVRQIAGILGISQGAVRVRLHRSRDRFRQAYEKEETTHEAET